jgi:hypothetical protein
VADMLDFISDAGYAVDDDKLKLNFFLIEQQETRSDYHFLC